MMRTLLIVAGVIAASPPVSGVIVAGTDSAVAQPAASVFSAGNLIAFGLGVVVGVAVCVMLLKWAGKEDD